MANGIPRIEIEISADPTAASKGFKEVSTSVEMLDKATAQYESQLRKLSKAQASGLLSAKNYTQQLTLIEREYLSASTAAAQYAGGTAAVRESTSSLAKILDGSRNKMRMLVQQFSQVAQQSVATGQPIQALAIQAADIGLAFGTVGTIVGAVAGIALPTLIAAFSSAADKGEEFKDTLEGLSEASSGANEILGRLRMSVDDLVKEYGTAAQRVREFSLAQAELFAAQTERRLREQIGLVQQLSTEYTKATRGNIGNIAALRRDFGVTTEQARVLFSEFQKLENAATFEQQQAQLQAMLGTLRDMGVNLSEIPEELNSALQEMLALGVETDRVRELMAQLGAEARGVTVGVPLFDQGFSGGGLLPPTQTGGGGSGRASGGKSRTRITSLLESLQTERETLEAWHVESMDLLAQANEAELEVLGGHAEAKLRIEQEYQDRLNAIRQAEQAHTLTSYGTLFGNLATTFQSGSGKLLKIGKSFSIAQGLINSYRAYTEVLADPSLIGRPFLRTALAASTLASGLAQVASIKSVSDSGGGGSAVGSGAAATPSSPATQNVVLDLRNATADTTQQIGGLVDMINEAGRQGYVLDIRTAR